MKDTEPNQFVNKPQKGYEQINQTQKTAKDFQKAQRAAREELRELALREAEE